MSYRFGIAAALAATGLAVAAPSASAVPYASGIRNTAGADWEFVLNEAADNVTILRNGGNPLDLGTLAAGRHTFSMAGFSSFDVEVSKNTPKAWTELSAGTNLFTRFEQPAGLAINKDASSPYFGTIYVANSRTGTTAETGTDPNIIPARAMGEGIYTLTGDLIGVDLSTPSFSAVANAQDTAQAKTPGWTNPDLLDTSTGVTTGGRSPWRIGLDEGGNLIVTDWSAIGGGIKWANPNLTNGGLLLAKVGAEGGAEGVTNSNGEFIHSNITSKPNISGTMGVDLSVIAADNGLLAQTGVAGSRSNVWRWNLGSFDPSVQTAGYEGVPELMIRGDKLLGDTNWYTTVPNVANDVHYSPEHDLYYMTQPRSDGFQSSLIIVKPGEAGADPVVLFSSLAFSVANGLDGNISAGATFEGIQDIFRNAGTVELSPDGNTMFLRRNIVNASTGNPVLGNTSNNSEAVLAIPLDEDGLPILTINDNGTPADPSDDRLVDFDGFQVASSGSSARNHELEFDAAGNAYVTSNVSERLQVFSPGGNTKAVTSSTGAFSVVAVVDPGLAGDFNDDDVVDGADFLAWQRGQSPGSGSAADLATWKANYGMTAPASATTAAVPEPATASLIGVGIAALMATRRRYGSQKD